MVVAGALAVYVGFTNNPIHTDPAAIPATKADVDAGPHVPSIEEGRRLARSFLVEKNLPGLSVAVAVDGKIVWAEGFGYADADGAPVTPLSRFRLGALSKPLT